MAYTGSNLDVDGTSETLTSGSNPFVYKCVVRADTANSANVHVGFASTVTAGTVDATDGWLLDAGDSVEIPAFVVNNTNLIYVIGSAANQKVFWFAY
jgi:hypothetical protein